MQGFLRTPRFGTACRDRLRDPHGAPWRDAPRAYRPNKTLYSHFIGGALRGVRQDLRAPVDEVSKLQRSVIDARHLNAHRGDKPDQKGALPATDTLFSNAWSCGLRGATACSVAKLAA